MNCQSERAGLQKPARYCISLGESEGRLARPFSGRREIGAGAILEFYIARKDAQGPKRVELIEF
jgi:hypothetical protein